MKKLVMLAFVAALATACSKDKPSCDKIFDHTMSLAPAEMRQMFEKNRSEAIAKCEKMSDEAKQCALDAKSMEELQKCPRS